MTKRGPTPDARAWRPWNRRLYIAAGIPLLVYFVVCMAEFKVSTDEYNNTHPPTGPIAVASRNTYDASVFPQEYAPFYSRSASEAEAAALVPLWIKAMDEYYAAHVNRSASGGSPHRITALLPMFTTTRPADGLKKHFRWLAPFLPWQPPFLMGYMHLVEDKRGFGLEEGRGLFSRPRYLSYLIEDDLRVGYINRSFPWLLYAVVVRAVEALYGRVPLPYLSRLARLLLVAVDLHVWYGRLIRGVSLVCWTVVETSRSWGLVSAVGAFTGFWK